ncbi:adhesion G protein-coupled receptor L1-like [Asterias rubens]|uniref:adhesion G protein-coupled receptor L1-like n=1 Tax=Asterias rubens TaxID=7604 RepID=UPI001454F12B|nr:adhesion G protein-coupled receptor L1-like [Asterias rubens]
MPDNDARGRRVKSLWMWGLTIVANIAVTGPSENTTYPSAATIQTTPAAPKCPDGWIEQNERCYSLSINDSLSWPEARLACQQTPGGDLLVYNSTEEKSYITKLIECPPIDGEPSYEKPTNLWIGLYRGCAEDPKIFQWVGGVDLSDELKNWEEGQPDNFFKAPPEPSPTPSPSSTMELFALTTTVQMLSTFVAVVESTTLPQPTPTPTFTTTPATNTLLTSHNTQSIPTMSSSTNISPSQYHNLPHTTQDTTTQVPQTTSDDVTTDDPRTTNRDGGSVTTETTSLAPPITSDQSGFSNTSPVMTTTTPIMCRAEILDALEWAETIEGVHAVQACPENPFAVVTRACVLISTTSATWRQPDFRDCQVPTTGDLLERLTYMYNSPTVEPGDVIKASYQLSQMLAPPTSDDGSAQRNPADEYSLLVESLEMLVALPSRLTECRPSDLNKFANSILQAVDNMLHPDNLAIWIGSPQVSADTVRVMDAVESFAAQTATANCNLILTPDDVTVPSFEGKYDNVVFRKSVETTARFEGLAYTASSPRASIVLPPEIFDDVTDTQVTLLVVFYPSIGPLLDDVTQPAAATNQKVMSSIVTSTAIHQSNDVFQKLATPLCINFTKTVATFDNEENCVYLGRSESGKSEWLTDGCWVNERKNGSLHCCCNHMTSFAIVGATEVIQQYQLLLLTYVLCSASCFIILLSTLILFSIRYHTISPIPCLNTTTTTLYFVKRQTTCFPLA